MRKSLLPDFLNTEAWTSLLDAVDTVFESNVDTPAEGVSKIRETTILSPEAEARMSSGQLIDESHLHTFDKRTNVLSGNMLGFGLHNSDMITEEQYARLLRNISRYWYSKGTGSLANFISYIFNSKVSIDQLWTKDYKKFVVPTELNSIEGEFKTIMEGGPWYPTSHVRVSYDPTVLTSVSVENLVALVYELGSYTMVVNNVATDSVIPLVHENEDDPVYPGFAGSQSVAMGLVSIVEVFLDSDDPLDSPQY
jgi:hypothetical protein